MNDSLTRRKISFHYSPFNFDKGDHAVEKSDSNGVKHRYLQGVASGSKIDGTGERITENAIKGMQSQAESGEILLYADRHDVRYTEDIGKLVESKILVNGDWFCTFMLYDASHGVGEKTLETIDKLWKQVNGLPPYEKKRQMGFSVEGYISDGGILKMETDGRRVIDEVILEGVITTPRPAYQDSIATAVYKALDEQPPWMIKKSISSTLLSKIEAEKSQDNFYKISWRLRDALDEEIEKIMSQNMEGQEVDALSVLFDEYKNLMIPSILENRKMFNNESNADTADENIDYLYKESKTNNKTSVNKSAILISLHGKLDTLEKQLTLKEK